jgi:hypothetical protein
LAADSGNTVHAFNIESEGLEYVIMHRRWTPLHGWTAPTDILLPGFSGVAPALVSVVIDGQDRIHLAFYGGNDQGFSVYYTWAEAAEADSSLAWSPPEAVGIDAAGVGTAGLAINARGDLVLVYGGERFGEGVYVMVSRDRGASWSDPALISRVSGEELWPTDIAIVADDDQRFHAVWATANAQGLNEEIRYARLEQDLSTWGHETVLARMDSQMELLGVPAIASSPEGLVVVFEDSFPPTKWIRRSSDGGVTWSIPVRPFPHTGGYGHPALVTDSAGTVHLVVGNRIGNPEVSGLWYSRLIGGQWLPLYPVVDALSTTLEGFGPCCVQAVVVGGNLLLATWAHNVPQDLLTGAWSSFVWLDAPAAPAMSLAERSDDTPVPSPISTTAVAVPPTATPTLSIEPQADRTTSLPSAGPFSVGWPIYLGAIPVVVLAGSLMFRRLRRPPAPPSATPDAQDATEQTNRNPGP